MAAAAVARVQSKPRSSASAARKARLAAVPTREFHPVQQIDNSRVRRSANPAELRTLLFYLAIGACVFVGVLAFSWQQFAIVKTGYDIADLKAKHEQLMEDNKVLGAHVEALHTPEHLNSVAFASGLSQPTQGQVIHLDAPLPSVEGEPVVAALHPYALRPIVKR